MRVQIYDQSYNIRGELDEAYVQQLAKFVDQKMRATSEATRTIDSLRVAVLTAINLADELHALRARQAELEGELRERAVNCLKLLDQALKQTA